MEAKVHLGEDVFSGEDGKPIMDECGKPLKQGCAKTVNLHNDLKFNDDGIQAKTDTASATEPTVTLSFGLTRTLIFERQIKNQATPIGN